MKYKKCSKCGLLKPITEFYRNKRDGLESWCKDCKKIDHKKYYQKNKIRILKHVSIYRKNNGKKISAYRSSHKKEALEQKRKYCKSNRKKLHEYERKKYVEFKAIYNNLKINGCAVCGSYNRLEFHHTNPKYKLFNIGSGCNKSVKDLSDELNKCILLCSKCHGKAHSKDKS